MDCADYFSIDGILADEKTVPCVWQSDGYRIGYLDQGAADEDVKLSAITDLPIWLARELSVSALVAVQLRTTKGYTRSQLSRLDAEANNVPLFSYPYYFRNGQEIAMMSKHKDAIKLVQRMQKAFTSRYVATLGSALHMRGSEIADYKRRLTEEEKILFDVCSNAQHELDTWLKGDCLKLSASALVANRTSSNAAAAANARKRKANE